MKIKKFIFIFVCAFLILIFTCFFPNLKYSKALRALENSQPQVEIVNANSSVETFASETQVNFYQKNSIHHALRHDDKTIFDVRYELGDFGLRIEDSKSPENVKHAFFGGCSYTFGLGLNEKQTLTAQLNALSSYYQSYNLAHPGATVNELIYDLKYSIESYKKINPKGFYFYVFIDEHVERFLQRARSFRPHRPVLAYEPDIHLLSESYESKYPLTTIFKKIVKGSLFYHFLNENTNLFLKPNDVEFENFCQSVGLLKQTYLNQFPEGQFVVLFHPLESSYANLLEKCLVKQRVSFESLKRPDLLQARILYDDHPSAEFNQKFAAEINQSFFSKIKN